MRQHTHAFASLPSRRQACSQALVVSHVNRHANRNCKAKQAQQSEPTLIFPSSRACLRLKQASKTDLVLQTIRVYPLHPALLPLGRQVLLPLARTPYLAILLVGQPQITHASAPLRFRHHPPCPLLAASFFSKANLP